MSLITPPPLPIHSNSWFHLNVYKNYKMVGAFPPSLSLSPLHLLLFSFLNFFFATDIEWKVTYVGCANDPTQDQVLEEVLVGPVSVGVNNFVLTAPAPDFSVIPVPDLIGVTVLLITCSYLEQEFVKIGYYVNNEYNDPSLPPPAPPSEEGQPTLPVPVPLPAQVDIQNMYRNILADKPIVTRINIDWSGNGGSGGGGDMPQEGEEEVEVFGAASEGPAANQTILVEEDSMDVERMQLNMRRIS
jgi:hypothetical protein